MDCLEPRIHSFIVKIWLEDTTQRGGHPVWRGQITHVPDGEQRYLRDLDDISVFIMPYLEQEGIKPPIWWRLRQWLNRWKRFLQARGGQ